MYSAQTILSPDGTAYLDIAEGLGRVRDNKKLFSRLLDTFTADPNWQKLCDSISAGDMPAAATAAHTVKGMCANLSMKALYAKTAELEVLLKASKMDEALFEQLKTARDETLRVVEVAKNELI